MNSCYLFLGDTHGDLPFVECAARFAVAHSAKTIIQAGDWGFLWPGNHQLDQLSSALVEHGVTMRFVDGNHDDHPTLRTLRKGVLNRGVEIAPSVIYQPRGSVHEDGEGTRFLFLGGAPSIDRASRTEGRSWWPEEVISQQDASRAMAADGPIHVLVTHDAPDFPPGFSPKGSPGYQKEQHLSLKRVDKLIRRHKPQLHVHGHWHAQYVRRHEVGTRIEGLNCNTYDPSFLSDAALLWMREP